MLKNIVGVKGEVSLDPLDTPLAYQESSQLSGLLVKCRPAVLMILGSNPGWGAQEFSKLTFIS